MAQRQAVKGVVARYYGQAGGTSQYWYWIQALYPSGKSPLSVAGATAADAQASLTKDNFNAVNWDPAPGAIGYRVFRTTTSAAPTYGSNFLVELTSQTGFKDDGTYSLVTTAIRADGVFVARALYDFAVDGGAVGAITPAISDTIPANAIVYAGVLNVPTAVTSLGSATVAAGTTAGSGAATIIAATGKASLTIDAVIELLGTNSQAATNKPAFKMTAAGQINITVAAAALTAGVIEILVMYVMPSNA